MAHGRLLLIAGFVLLSSSLALARAEPPGSARNSRSMEGGLSWLDVLEAAETDASQQKVINVSAIVTARTTGVGSHDDIKTPTSTERGNSAH